MLLTAILCCIIFALAGLLNGILARSFDDTMLFANFILSPLIVGGVFYDIHDLPHVWYMYPCSIHPLANRCLDML